MWLAVVTLTFAGHTANGLPPGFVLTEVVVTVPIRRLDWFAVLTPESAGPILGGFMFGARTVVDRNRRTDDECEDEEICHRRARQNACRGTHRGGNAEAAAVAAAAAAEIAVLVADMLQKTTTRPS